MTATDTALHQRVREGIADLLGPAGLEIFDRRHKLNPEIGYRCGCGGREPCITVQTLAAEFGLTEDGAP